MNNDLKILLYSIIKDRIDPSLFANGHIDLLLIDRNYGVNINIPILNVDGVVIDPDIGLIFNSSNFQQDIISIDTNDLYISQISICRTTTDTGYVETVIDFFISSSTFDVISLNTIITIDSLNLKFD